MSTLFKYPPRSFIKHKGFKFADTQRAVRTGDTARTTPAQSDTRAVDPRIAAFLLKDDHLALMAIDGLLALYAKFKAKFQTWRSRRRTLKALAGLNDRQLRDIGLSRGDMLFKDSPTLWRRHESYRALAELDESQLSNLSEQGVRAWREVHRIMQQGC